MSSQKKLAAALDVITRLQAEGHQAYLAGGCVRDLLLGRTPSDYDVATSATPDRVLQLFPRCFAVGAHFGVVLVSASGGEDSCQLSALSSQPSAPPQVELAPPLVAQVGQVVTEVATFRSDGVYSDGRHPDAVRYTLSAAEDVQRRDFTVNGLLLDPLRGGGVLEEIFTNPQKLRATVEDHVGGLADLDAGVVRAIGQPADRFEEDHLRMLRAVRFTARLGFALDPATAMAMRTLASRIAAVSRERVRDELTKMLVEGHARRAFELLDETGLLGEVLPEVARMKGVEQPPQYHPEGDVWQHVLLLLEQLEPGCSKTLAWAALLHDVGKPATFQRAADRIRFNGHAEVGVAIASELCSRFRFSNEETEQIVTLVAHHMRFMEALRMKESTIKRFLRLDRFEEHLALHRMDCLAGSGYLENWKFMQERWQSTSAESFHPQPLLTGHDLIAAGYRSGPEFRDLLNAAEDAQLEGRIHTVEEALALLRSSFGEPALRNAPKG
ncbi:CCA tRNA nucleotidyltransferase [Telmatobacter bradus]|uniref:CCA tRNA nucleotidyltransferase n=1 Tax=Telmatobacter bradus TaxID=474953 RepID=UPI003B42BEF8